VETTNFPGRNLLQGFI